MLCIKVLKLIQYTNNVLLSVTCVFLITANVKPFGIYYHTNGDETSTNTVDDTGNMGFCFNFENLWEEEGDYPWNNTPGQV